MKILVFGLGSIGSRHVRLLKEIAECELYAFRSGQGRNENSLGVLEIQGWQEVDVLKPDIALIANPTYLHIETAYPCAERGMTLFLEKPIDVSTKHLDDLIDLVAAKKIPTYIAYVLRFHPVVKALKERLKNRAVRRARFVSRSYLPDWRPGRDYRKCYSALWASGGGALLDVSHELDLAQFLFGPVQEISGRLERRSDVTIDADDFVQATVRCGSIESEIIIDIASRRLERTIRIETDQGVLEGDLLKGTLQGDGFEKDVPGFDDDRDGLYREQLRYFFAHQNDPEMMNNLVEASPLFRKMIRFREQGLLRDF